MVEFQPIEGEFWIVEMRTTPDDPDYGGPFASVADARDWARAQGSEWSDFVTINLVPPGHFEREQQR